MYDKNEKGYLYNCHIEPKDDEDGPLFEHMGSYVVCRLDGYAIIPLEKYRTLVEGDDPYKLEV